MELLKFQFAFFFFFFKLWIYTHAHAETCIREERHWKKLLILKRHVFRRWKIAGANLTWRPRKSISFEHISSALDLSYPITYYLSIEAWFTYCTRQPCSSEEPEVGLKEGVYRISTHLLQRWKVYSKWGKNWQERRGGSQDSCSQMSRGMDFLLPANTNVAVLRKTLKPSTMRGHSPSCPVVLIPDWRPGLLTHRHPEDTCPSLKIMGDVI